MDRGLSHGSPTSPHLTRRGFLTAAAGTAGAVAAAPLLAGCGNAPAVTTGSTSTSELAKIMPAYAPLNVAIKPDYPSVDGSEPGYLSYPATLVHTVSRDAGQRRHLHRDRAGLGRDPAHRRQHLLPGAECRARREHAVAADQRRHDHHHPAHAVRGQQAARLDRGAEPGPSRSGFGQATASKLADLTPYLAGDKIKKYPNLAAIFSNGWQQGIWNNKISASPPSVVQLRRPAYSCTTARTSWTSSASARRR